MSERTNMVRAKDDRQREGKSFAFQTNITSNLILICSMNAFSSILDFTEADLLLCATHAEYGEDERPTAWHLCTAAEMPFASVDCFTTKHIAVARPSRHKVWLGRRSE